MLIPLRLKYRIAGTAKKNKYSARTGPHCCCDHKAGNCCQSTRKKRVVKKPQH